MTANIRSYAADTLIGEEEYLPAPSELNRLWNGSARRLALRAEQLLAEGLQLRSAFAIRRFTEYTATDEGLLLGGVLLKSRALAARIAPNKELYIYLVTGFCRELPPPDAGNYLDGYLLDQLAYLAYFQAMERMTETARQELGVLCQMRLCPGAVEDWPAAEVSSLLTLLGDAPQRIGVELLPGGMMAPLKSAVGLFRAADREFVSCTLCPLRSCDQRRLPFVGLTGIRDTDKRSK